MVILGLHRDNVKEYGDYWFRVSGLEATGLGHLLLGFEVS